MQVGVEPMLITDYNQLLSMEVDDLPDVRVIHLVGECDLSTASMLGTELNQAIADGRHVVLDVHLLTYIDSTGVLTIATAQETLAQNRRQLRIAGAHGILSRILRISRLDGHIPTHETVDEAIQEIVVSANGRTPPA